MIGKQMVGWDNGSLHSILNSSVFTFSQLKLISEASQPGNPKFSDMSSCGWIFREPIPQETPAWHNQRSPVKVYLIKNPTLNHISFFSPNKTDSHPGWEILVDAACYSNDLSCSTLKLHPNYGKPAAANYKWCAVSHTWVPNPPCGQDQL